MVVHLLKHTKTRRVKIQRRPEVKVFVSQIVIPSREVLSQWQIVATLKVSKGAVHETLKFFAETESVVSKGQTKSGDQTIRGSIHQA